MHGEHSPISMRTVPTVNAPASLATSATIGAAPDPVPPPIPAVTKTRSLPATNLYAKMMIINTISHQLINLNNN